jgi:hypothetical protein
MKTPEDMAKAQEALAETAEHVLDADLQENETTSLDIRNLKIMNASIQLSQNMAKEEEYHIPLVAGGQVTTVRLKLVRSANEKGKVKIAYESDKFGSVAAQVKVSGEKAQAVVAVASADAKQALEPYSASLQQMLEAEALSEETQTEIVESGKLNLGQFMEGSESDAISLEEAKQTDTYEVQTKQLYSTAKQFLEWIKTIERIKNDED